jgi:hypothetical protein
LFYVNFSSQKDIVFVGPIQVAQLKVSAPKAQFFCLFSPPVFTSTHGHITVTIYRRDGCCPTTMPIGRDGRAVSIYPHRERALTARAVGIYFQREKVKRGLISDYQQVAQMPIILANIGQRLLFF